MTTLKSDRPTSGAGDKAGAGISKARGLRAVAWAVGLGVVAIASVQIFLVLTAANDGVTAVLGQRGDFFAGFLNPVLTALTLGGLFYTLQLQREASAALAQQNDMIRAQNYQAGFYQLLAIHNDIVGSLKTHDTNEKKDVNGRDAFAVMYSRLTRVYWDKREYYPDASEENVLFYAWDTLFKDEQSQLGHYFRFLYNTIKLLQVGQDAATYIKILRAQLSNQELLLLFYNCAVGQHGAEFRPLATDHVLFDNIPARLIQPEHADLLPSTVFGPDGYEGIMKRHVPRVRGDMTENLGRMSVRRVRAKPPTSAGEDPVVPTKPPRQPRSQTAAAPSRSRSMEPPEARDGRGKDAAPSRNVQSVSKSTATDAKPGRGRNRRSKPSAPAT